MGQGVELKLGLNLTFAFALISGIPMKNAASPE